MTGYNKPLYILPFDHRSTFLKGLLGVSGKEPTAGEIESVKSAKRLIYEAFQKASLYDVPKEGAAILVDEQFGAEILIDAKKKGYTTLLTTEKSGQELFDFEYGPDYKEHIIKIKPTFVKALIRYHPDGNTNNNRIQLERLKNLSDFCQAHDYKFLIEPLIPPTEEELAREHGDKSLYDREIRPELAVRMIKEFQDAGVEVDVWKIEGLSDPLEYQHVVTQARTGGRDGVGIVILGRGESKEMVVEWIKAGRSTPGVIGFAVGRTIFWQPLVDLKDGKIDRNMAIDQIVKNYIYFYQLFTGKIS